jgi:hypothetical protein
VQADPRTGRDRFTMTAAISNKNAQGAKP